MPVSFALGFCRACGASVMTSPDGAAVTHPPDHKGKDQCEGSAHPITDDPRLTFYRITRRTDDTSCWIVVSRGEAHARDIFAADDADSLTWTLLDEDEIIAIEIDRVLIGSIQIHRIDDTSVRWWRVGTIATEIRR